MELVTVKGGTERTRLPRSLAVDEFQNFANGLTVTNFPQANFWPIKAVRNR